MNIVLGKHIFNNGSKAKKFISSYLKTNKKISTDDMLWILDLLKRHPNWINKSIDMDKIILYENRSYNVFGILKNNGVIEDISYHKCVDGGNKKKDEYKALRDSIACQIIDYRNKYFDNNDVNICSLCDKTVINNKDIHVDHIKQFVEIVENFKSKYDIHVIPNKSKGSFRYISDGKIDKLWKNYHIENSYFRMLCEKCNLGRDKSQTKYKNDKPINKVKKKVTKVNIKKRLF